MQFCFCNLSKVLFTILQFLRFNKYILVFLNILLFQFDLRDIHIQLFINKFTNLSEFFHTAENQSTTLDKTFIVVMSLYTVMSVNRTVFIDLNSDFKIKMNSSDSYEDSDTVAVIAAQHRQCSHIT